MSSNKKVTVRDILSRKKQGKRISMLTCYDYSFACLLDRTALDIILVGDSLANVVLGMERTKDVSFREMFNHTKAVAKGAKRALVVADMPFVSYQKNKSKALYFAKKFTEEAGAGAVKLEWFPAVGEVTKVLRKHKIPVMGHVGLTPQRTDKLGGFKVQGKDFESARNILKQAALLEEYGAFSVVLECIPGEVSRIVTRNLTIPTIGIGAGASCDGQVLVLYDILGLFVDFRPRFVKTYQDLAPAIEKAVNAFVGETRKGCFPTHKESFLINQIELSKQRKESKKIFKK